MPATTTMRGMRCSTRRRRWQSIAAGNVFIVDTENHVIRLIDAQSWIVRTIAGSGKAGSDGLARPHGAVVGADGAIYIGDSENHRVRKLVQARP